MAWFEALAVSGDAFLLVGRHIRLLVDGGRSSRRLVQELEDVRRLDVVICTHNDIDHAGGLTELLDQRGAPSIGEFWLPGQWAEQLEDLVRWPEKFELDLIQEIFGTYAGVISALEAPAEADGDPQGERWLDDTLLAGLGHEIRRGGDARDLDPVGVGPDVIPVDAVGEDWKSVEDPSWVRELRREDGLKVQENYAWARVLDPLPRRSDQEMQRLHAVLREAIATADRVRRIALQAIRCRIPIRWFDFQVFAEGAMPSGGRPGVLEPVNACEVVMPPLRPPTSRLEYLTLTKVNRHCLVFQLLERARQPSVLFCGDSPLTGARAGAWPGLRRQPSRRLLATAPHHGRPTNAGAYAIVDGWVGGRRDRVIWVKSGSLHPPCAELQSRERMCTACAPFVMPAEAIQLAVANGEWRPLGRLCAC